MYTLSQLISLTCALGRSSARNIESRDTTGLAVTNNILELTAAPYSAENIPPSSRHLAKHRNDLIARRTSRRQTTGTREDLLTLGGRLYITKATIAGRNYSFVVDTGSSDTWIISSDFKCQDPSTLVPVPNSICNFGPYFNTSASSTFSPVNFDFSVMYTGGEFLLGKMGTDTFGIGGLSSGKKPYINVKQTLGVVDRGFWYGDGISSGLMGLSYPALARGVNSGALNYTSVLFTLFKNSSIPPILSLALSRPTAQNPRAGGVMAIGGIPNITYNGTFVTVPLQPAVGTIFAWYSIIIDGYDIRPPPTPKQPNPTTVFRSWPLQHSTTEERRSTKAQRKRQLDFSKMQFSMIIDSGTSLVYLPDTIADYIASLFSPPARYNAQTNMYIVPCTARAPRVGIIIGGKPFYIHEDDLMNRGAGAVGGPEVGAAKGQCALAVQRAQGGSLVLGDTWLKNVLVVLDLAKGLDIGVAGSDRNGDGGGVVRIAARENY